MSKLGFFNYRVRKPFSFIIAIALVISMVGAYVVSAVANADRVMAASVIEPINLMYYGWHNSTTDQSIINAHPRYLVGNSSAGPWKGNANINTFTSAGIKYFEYIDGGYEAKAARAIPDDLQSNLNYVSAAAAAGAYGVFVDEVSDGVYTPANYSYLQQIASKAHSLGLKVVFNTGMYVWADQLMTYCDFINSSETWSNAALTASQRKWASRTWLITYNVTDAATAANLTNGAISKGIASHYACTSFVALPSWLSTYVGQISNSAPAPTTLPTTPAGQTAVTFRSNPTGSEVWLDYYYKGLTPLTLTVSTGSHHIGFNKYGYHNNTALGSNFVMGSTSMTVTGDLVSGQITNAATSGSKNTVGTVVGTPVATGATNEYNFYLKITSTSASGVTVAQQLWCSASKTTFPNLLIPGVALTGNLDNSAGWWVIK